MDSLKNEIDVRNMNNQMKRKIAAHIISDRFGRQIERIIEKKLQRNEDAPELPVEQVEEANLEEEEVFDIFVNK